MQLRELYHTGDPTMPSVFLIEYSGEKAFFNKFQTLRDYIQVKEPITISPAQLFFPWEGLQDEAKEGQWIFSKDKVINLPNEDIKLEYENFSVESVCDIFRSWVQKLQLDSLNKILSDNETQECAKITQSLMMDI